MHIIEEKLRAGLSLRLASLQNANAEPQDASWSRQIQHPSLFNMFANSDTRSISSEHYPSWLILSAGLTSGSVPAQLRTIAEVSQVDREFHLLYGVGASFVPAADLPALEQLLGAEDADFSLVFESLLRFAPPGEAIAGHHERLQTLCTNILRHNKGFEESSPEAPMSASSKVLQGFLPHYRSISRYREHLATYKARFIHIFGPDLFTIFQVALDPAVSFTEAQLSAAARLTSDWGLTSALASLLLFRLLGPHKEERAFLNRNIEGMLRPTHSTAELRVISAILHGETVPRLNQRQGIGRSISQELIHLASVHNALQSRNAAGLVASLVELFCLDPALPLFLDWETVHKIIRNYRTINPKTAVVTYMMNDEVVKAKYPYVVLATGKGALIGELTELLSLRKRGRSIAALMTSFRGLPDSAAQALTTALLDRSTIERIAAALPKTKLWTKGLPAGESIRISMVRIEALNVAREKRLISGNDAHRQIQMEIDNLRIAYFRGRMRSGRVRIDWRAIEQTVEEALERYLAYMHYFGPEGHEHSDVRRLLRPLTAHTAGKIASLLLYECEDCIDQALSNNLRHGIIVPRFLRAFDDAFQTVSNRKALPSWGDPGVARSFGCGAEYLVTLRDCTSETMKAFVENHLKIQGNGDVERSFADAISACMDRQLRARPEARPLKMQKAITGAARRCTSELLAVAGSKLEQEVGAHILAQVGATRLRARTSALDANEMQRLGQFLDCLESNLHEAIEEVKQWLRVSGRETQIVPFRLAEIVHLHLLSTALSAWDKLRVQTSCFRGIGMQSREQEFLINGRYIHLIQEVVHNLLSNAFKHSGEGLTTCVELKLFVEDRVTVFQCRNSIADDKINQVIRNFGRTLTLVRSTDGDSARKDDSSGFQKIRRACLRASKQQPLFHIPSVSTREKIFTIELKVHGLTGVIAQ